MGRARARGAEGRRAGRSRRRHQAPLEHAGPWRAYAAIIELGRQTFGDHKVTLECFARVKKLFPPTKLVDLVMLMGNYAATAALLTAFDMQLPEGQKPMLPVP